MGQLRHVVRSAGAGTAEYSMFANEDDLWPMVGVGGAYHAEVAWERFVGTSDPARLSGRARGVPVSAAMAVGVPENGTRTSLAKHESDALGAVRRELRDVSARLVAIQELERQRIASDLHDGIGQSLSLLKLSLEAMALEMEHGAPVDPAASLQQMSNKVKDAIAELRRTVMDLRPPMLDDLGILPTISWFFREFEAVWGVRKLEKIIAIEESDVPSQLRTAIFRILQEAMNNTVKHARADWVRVQLTKVDGALLFAIEDNGRGFDVERMSARTRADGGLGLVSMLERARSSDGLLDIRSAPGRGTRISVSWHSATQAPVCGEVKSSGIHGMGGI